MADSVQRSPPGPVRSHTILVVEDDLPLLNWISKFLRSRGFGVLGVPDGVAAMHTCRDYGGRIDVLLTDLVLPKMHGSRVATEVTRVRPEIRVICMSGYPTEPGDKPCAAFLAKPFSGDQLVDKISGVIGAAES